MTAVDLRSETFRRLANDDFSCEKELTMSVISGKYKVVILWHLGNEHPYRYGELSRLFKQISNRMLTKQLRELEHDDIIKRTQYQSKILHTEYSLTERGMTLLPIINAIYRWGQENMPFYVEQLHHLNKASET